MFMLIQPFMSCLCLYNHLCHVYMITIYGMLCLYDHLSCYVYVYTTIYVMFICLYNHLCHVYMITIYVMFI